MSKRRIPVLRSNNPQLGRIIARALQVLVGLVMLFTGVLLASRANATPNPPVYDYSPGLAEASAGPQRPIGSLAPDLALPSMESCISNTPYEKLPLTRLSSFRGKKPVVLIFSAFT